MNTTKEGQLACAYGELWLGPHYICAANTSAVCGVPISEVILPDLSHLKPKQLVGWIQPSASEWSLFNDT